MDLLPLFPTSVSNLPCRARPRQALPSLPCLAVPFLTKPRQASPALPSLALPCPAIPATPRLAYPCLTQPRLAGPDLAAPAEPCHALPRPTLPAKPNPATLCQATLHRASPAALRTACRQDFTANSSPSSVTSSNVPHPHPAELLESGRPSQTPTCAPTRARRLRTSSAVN